MTTGREQGRGGLRDRGRVWGVAVLLGLAAALALATAGGAQSPGTSAAHATAAAFAPPFEPARRARQKVHMRVALPLRRAALVRRDGGGLKLRGRPSGSARLRTNTSTRTRLRLGARSLAIVLDGLVGRASIRTRIGGRRVTLRRPRIRGGRLVATVRGAGRRPRRLGAERLTGTIERRRVHRRGRCTLLPFASCRRARMPLADLLQVDLRGGDLRRANLHGVYAHGAQLAAADLRQADLRGADLTDADLRRADLRGANLADANLRFARLGGAKLGGAFICRTRLPGRRARTKRHCGRPVPRRRALAQRSIRALPAPRRARTAAAPAATPRAVAAQAAGRPGSDPADPAPPLRADQSCYFYSNTADADGDGLTDCYEATPRSLAVTSAADLNGSGQASAVTGITSSTTSADTDGDGLRDGAETKISSHPGRPDTDLDGLADQLEWGTYGSNLTHADSDGDSIAGTTGRDGNLFDGPEALSSKTSPTDPDTDGDTMSDYQEIRTGGTVFKPRVANLPRFTVGVDPKNPHVGIQVPYKTTTGEVTEKKTSRTTVTAESHTESHSLSVEIGVKFTEEFEESAEVGVPEDEVEQRATIGSEQSITTGTTNKWEDTQKSEQEYANVQSDETSKETEIDPTGCLQATLQFTNPGDVGFRLESPIQVNAEIPDPDDPQASQVLTTLQPIDGNPNFDAPCPPTAATTIQLADNSTRTISFAGTADSQALLDFMAEPVPITFTMGNYKIVDADDKPFEKILQDVDSKTATVVVDRGPCLPSDVGCDPQHRIDQYQVAATVTKARVGGTLQPTGITVDDALQTLGLAPVYGGGGSGRAKLTAVAGLANDPDDPNRGHWTVVASEDTGVADGTVDFPDVALKPKDHIVLTYMRDADDDGIPSNMEVISGTSELAKDTDGDGLSDKAETRVGWTVPLQDPDPKSPRRPSYKVFSSPLSCDADGDGSPDGPGRGTSAEPCPKGPAEATRGKSVSHSPTVQLGSDPKRADTNFDGETDGKEAYPRVLQNVPPGSRAPVFAAQFGAAGRGGGGFNRPAALAIDRFGDTQQAWINDPANKLIQSFQLGSLPFTHVGDVNKHVAYAGLAVSPQGTGSGAQQGRIMYAGLLSHELLGPDSFLIQRFNTATAEPIGSPSFALTALPDLPAGASAYLDVDPSGNVYAALASGRGRNGRPVDARIASVRKFDPNGRESESQGAYPGIANPTGLAVGPKGNVVVSQNVDGVPAVTRYDPSGRISSSLAGPNGASGVGVDRNGYVYVASSNDIVYKFSNDLTYLTHFGGPGRVHGRFDDPVDIDADKSGDIYVLDSGNDFVQLFAYPFGEGPPQ